MKPEAGRRSFAVARITEQACLSIEREPLAMRVLTIAYTPEFIM